MRDGMRTTKLLPSIALLLWAPACSYGPEDIPALESAREVHLKTAREYQRMIDTIHRHGRYPPPENEPPRYSPTPRPRSRR
jgi:hypothetical protein